MSGVLTRFPLYAFMVWTGTHLSTMMKEEQGSCEMCIHFMYQIIRRHIPLEGNLCNHECLSCS